jgi:SAM-dependent methyltransferase
MKARDSGMPEEDLWESFFDPEEVLKQLGLDDAAADVVDFGCGYGTFAIAAAGRTLGTVRCFDIDPTMVAATLLSAAAHGLPNLRAMTRDFLALGTGLPTESVDYALLFNILHAEDPMQVLQEAWRILRPGGKVAVIHWVHDKSTPRGPDLGIRPRPDQCRAWLETAGFTTSGDTTPLPPYHYGLVGRKAPTESRA